VSDVKVNDGGPAFGYPNFGCTSTPDGMIQPQFYGGPGGVTVRDYFAAKAMQAIIQRHGVLSCNANISSAEARDIHLAGCDEDGNCTLDMCHAGTAIIAYEIANTMLAARKEAADANRD